MKYFFARLHKQLWTIYSVKPDENILCVIINESNMFRLFLSCVSPVWCRLCDRLQSAEPLGRSTVLFHWTKNTGVCSCVLLVCVYLH